MSVPRPIDAKASRTRRWASGVAATSDIPIVPTTSSGLRPSILIAARLARDEARFEIFRGRSQSELPHRGPGTSLRSRESRSLIAQPFQFRCGPCREDAEDEQLDAAPQAWAARRTPRDGRVSHPCRRAAARPGSSRPPCDQRLIARESFLDPAGMMAQSPADDVLAGGPGQVELDVLASSSLSPVGEGPDPSPFAGKLGDEGILHPDRRGQVPDERLEEVLARAPRRPLDDRAEGSISSSSAAGAASSRRCKTQSLAGRPGGLCRGRVRFSVHGIVRLSPQ